MSNLQNVSNRYRERGGSGGGGGGHYDLSKSTIYPVAGALLGTCLGGPVGMLAGVKIGGLAAIGGSVFGRKAIRAETILENSASCIMIHKISRITYSKNQGSQ